MIACAISLKLASQNAIATCDGITSATENNYRIEVTGLTAASIYDISIGGILVVDDTTGITTYTSANQAFVDGTSFKSVEIDEGADGIGVVTITVHELLCVDADDDGDIDQHEGSGDYTIALPDIGTIISQVAPHNTENVYLYILTDENGDVGASVTSSTSGLFTNLSDGQYRVYAYNFLTSAEATTFLGTISANDDMDGFTSSTDPCYSFCGKTDPYTLDNPCLVNITNLPASVTICESTDESITVTATIDAPVPIGATLEYQWQEDDGSGFSNFADTDATLNLSDVSLSMDGNDYRVIVIMDVGGLDICKDTSNTTTISVDPKAILSTGLDATVCSDENSGITLSTSGGGTIDYYNIPSANVAVGLTGSATSGTSLAANALASDNFTNTTSGNLDVVYKVVTITTDGCPGDTTDVTLTVRPEPLISNQTEGAVCSDIAIGSVTYGTSSGVAASGHDITSVNSNGLSLSAGTSSVTDDDISDDAWTNTGSSTVNVVYTVVPSSAAGCDGASFTVTVPIDPSVVVEAGAGAPICSNGTIDLTSLGASISGALSIGTWTTSTGGTFDNDGYFGIVPSATRYTPNATDISAGSVTITLTSDDPSGLCDAVSDTVTITINDVTCGTFPWTGN